MEIELEAARTVAAPREPCWELLTDVSRAPEWLTVISSAHAEGPPGEGRTIHATGGILGIRLSTRHTVHLWRPHERYGWRTEHPFAIVVELTLDELTPSTTRLIVHAGAEPGGFFRVGRPIVARAAKSQLRRSADRFQRLVETRA